MVKTLAGDRAVEWSWTRDHLPHNGAGKLVLDTGPMSGFDLSMDALAKGYIVTAVGLEDIIPPRPLPYERQDILTYNPNIRFDYILNCSTIEHVGLGRYGDPLGTDFDFDTMAHLRELMRPDGKQILTCPIGQDAVVGHWHRVYGPKRLPGLLEGYKVLKEQYYVKAHDDSAWVPCSKERALTEVPGLVPEPSMLNLSYALGCFVLCLA